MTFVPYESLLRRRSAAPKRKARVLLIELPFKTVTRPSIGLGLLASSLEAAGNACQVRYANLEFAARVGVELYRTIAERVPEPLLIGDIAFAPALDPRAGKFQPLRDRGALFLADGSPIGSAPDWLWDRLPELQREAALFTREIAEDIARGDFEIVGFSCMFQTTPSLAVARLLKRLAPEKHIVFGGSHCEAEMGLALHESYPFIDFVCRGEGERAIVDLANALAGAGPSFAEIPGLVWRDGGETRAGSEYAARVEDLDQLPIPRYDDYFAQLTAALPDLGRDRLELPFETSRGCWYGAKHHCTFCGLQGERMTFRSKSPERVLEELRALDRYGVHFLYAIDLILDHRYFESLLPALRAEPPDHTIFFETKSNLTRRQLELLRDARIRMIQPGIESLSTPVLARMRKGVTGLQNIRLLKWAAELGVAVFWTLLYGFPGDRESEYAELASLLPALTHLMPPQGGYRVRVDRFSPLFTDPGLGAGRLEPSPAYAIAHALPAGQVRRIAYHFEAENIDGARPLESMTPIARSLGEWRDAFGEESFVLVDRGEVLHLHDRRKVATVAHSKLTGVERKVLLACEAGATAANVASSLGEPIQRVEAILAGFLARRWVIALDNKHLSVAVPMGELLPRGLPEQAEAALAHGLYTKRVASLGEIVPRASEPPPGRLEQRS